MYICIIIYVYILLYNVYTLHCLNKQENPILDFGICFIVFPSFLRHRD